MEAVLEEMDRQDEIIMEEDTLPTISEECNNLWYFVLLYMCYKLLFLKGQSNEIFDLQFFSTFEPAWITDQWLKIFSILVLIICWVVWILLYCSVKKTDTAGTHKKNLT